MKYSVNVMAVLSWKPWEVQGSNAGGGEISHTHTDWSWGPPSLVYNGYRVSFFGVKWQWHCVDHSAISVATVVNEWSSLYPCFPFALMVSYRVMSVVTCKLFHLQAHDIIFNYPTHLVTNRLW